VVPSQSDVGDASRHRIVVVGHGALGRRAVVTAPAGCSRRFKGTLLIVLSSSSPAPYCCGIRVAATLLAGVTARCHSPQVVGGSDAGVPSLKVILAAG
jgi:hypothetical protein